MSRIHDSLDQVLKEYASASISRREAMRRAAALGLSASVVAGLITGMRPAGLSAASTGKSAGLSARFQDEPTVGGTLREGYDLDFSRMDPVGTNWYDPAFSAIYENVITNDPDGAKVPQIAESWEISEDGVTVTFNIRSGLTFHSGDPLDAAAVAAAFNEIKENGSLNVFFAPVETIEATDESTVVLNMAHPYYDVINVVDTGYWSIFNQRIRSELESAEPGTYGQQEIDGSGPFTFGEWVPGSHVTVDKWEEYPGSIVPYFQNQGPAYLDGIRWEFISEAAQRAIRIENGEIDTLRGPAAQDVSRLEGNSDLNVVRLREWSGYIMGVNHTRTALDFHEVTMRQAISAAINRQAISDALLFGEGEPLFGPITSADRYYTADVEQFNQFDLEGAQAMVAELGWTPGDDGILEKNGQRMEFTMPVQDESFNRQLGTVIQDQLRQLGMDVTIEAQDRGTYFNTLASDPDSYLFYYLWPVPIDVVILFVGSGTIPNPNWAQASIPEVDAAIEAWQNAANEEELAAAGAQFQLAVAEHLPTIPLINRNAFWVSRSNVQGYLPHQWNLYPFYNDVWLS